MEQPAALVRHSSQLKYIVILLSSFCVVALCFPLANRLISYYQVVSMVRRFPHQPCYSSCRQPLYSSDLANLITFDETGKGIVWDYATQRIIGHIPSAPAGWTAGAWSPAKRYLLYTSENGLYLWDLAGQKKVFSVSQESYVGYREALWSPDNQRIAVVYTWGLTMRDAATGKLLAQYQLNTDTSFYKVLAAWSPDGKRIAFGGYQTNDTPAHVRVLDASTLSVISEAFIPITNDWSHLGNNIQMAWSPDGTTIAVSFGEQFWLVSPIKGVKARTINDRYDGLWTGPLAWSPDSKQLAFFGGSYDNDSDIELGIWRVTDLRKIQAFKREHTADFITGLYWPPKTSYIRAVTFDESQESFPLSGW